MSSVADIWNEALGLVGNDGEVQDPDTETNAPARACRRYWVRVRDEVLRDFAWPKFKTVADLTLVEADPNAGTYWAFSYAQPASCIRILRVLNGSSLIDTERTRVPFELGRKNVDGSVLIHTNLDDAQLEFIYHETNPERWDPDLCAAMALLLATKIAAHFGPDAVKLGDRALRLYVWRIAQARANAANEVQPQFPPDGGSFVEARG